jgi:hypothetical protein
VFVDFSKLEGSWLWRIGDSSNDFFLLEMLSFSY